MNIQKALLFLVFILMGAWFSESYAQYDKTPRRKANQDFEQPNPDITERKHKQNRFPVQYPPLREANLMWQKRVWREVDLIQKKNHVFYFPRTPRNGRASLASYVFDSIASGSIVAYENNTPIKFQAPMTPSQFKKNLTTEVQKTKMEQTEDGLVEVDTTLEVTLKPSDVKRLRLMEDWYFDKERSMFEVRIIGIGFIFDDGEGDLSVKFWLYYPHARRALARSENIVHGGNRAQAYSYASIFEKRRFSSLITKVDNVYDRYIQSYTEQQETLYEAQRLERDLMLFEQNLWEY